MSLPYKFQCRASLERSPTHKNHVRHPQLGHCVPTAFSLMEVIAAISIATAVAVAIVPRLVKPADTTKSQACQLNKVRLDLEVERWRRMRGAWPNSLEQVLRESNQPDGGLRCPVNNERYELDPMTRRVAGHRH